MEPPKQRRPDFAARAEEPPFHLRMSAEERSRLAAKAEIAGIPARAGSWGPNLSEAARRAIEAWQPCPPPINAQPVNEVVAARRQVKIEGSRLRRKQAPGGNGAKPLPRVRVDG